MTLKGVCFMQGDMRIVVIVLPRFGATWLQNDVDHFLFKIEAYGMSLQKGLGQGLRNKKAGVLE